MPVSSYSLLILSAIMLQSRPIRCTIQSTILNFYFSYFEVIKDPMDLCTMGAKLEDGMYKNRFAFQDDFRLMVSNAKRYNAPGSFAHSEAIALEIFFEKRK